MNTNPLVAALKYAADGWRVVPLWEPKTDGTCTCPKGSNCSSPGKHPRLNNGHLGASTDPDQIRTWWRQWPNANIGLVTDGSVVIDFDPQHGGLDTLAEWTKAHGADLEGAPRNFTGDYPEGRGVHLRFRQGDRPLRSATNIAPGVDVRANGGYIVAGPSLHPSGVHYEWGVGVEPVVPEWLVDIILGAPGPEATTSNPFDSPPPSGTRNDWMAQMCGHLAVQYRDDPESYDAAWLEAYYSIEDREDFPEAEARDVANSIWKIEHADSTHSAARVGRRIDTVGVTARVQAEQAWLALVESNKPERLFRSGSTPVRIEVNDLGQPSLRPLTRERTTWELMGAAHFVAVRRDGESVLNPPYATVAAVLATPDIPLPILTRMVAAPVFGASGELQTEPGYHSSSKTLYVPARGFTFEPPSENPTDHEITMAMDLFDELLWDFPWDSPASKANAISLLLLLFVRDLIDGQTPLYLIDKPAPGTGSGLLAEVLLLPALGVPPGSMSGCRSEEEWRKRLTAMIASRPSVVVFDNLEGKLDSSSLSSAMTQPEWTDRILGRSDVGQWSIRNAWVATANNLQLSTDMARRTVKIGLDAQTDEPWRRTDWRHELPRWAYKHRAEMVRAALTVGRAWISRGRPMGKVTLGSFDNWARVLGGMLGILEVKDFLANATDLYEQADSDRAINNWIAEKWWAKYHDNWMKVADILWFRNDPDFPLYLGDRNEDGKNHQFSLYLHKIRGRHIRLEDGTMVQVERSASMSGHAYRWRLVDVNDAPTLPL